MISWVDGKSCHVEGKCVPDLSCCNSRIKTPVSLKIRYLEAVAADDLKTVMVMDSMFASNFALPDVIVTECDHAEIQ